MSQDNLAKLANRVSGSNDDVKEMESPDFATVNKQFDVQFGHLTFPWDPHHDVVAGSDTDDERQWTLYWKDLRREIRRHFDIKSFVLKYGDSENSDLGRISTKMP